MTGKKENPHQAVDRDFMKINETSQYNIDIEARSNIYNLVYWFLYIEGMEEKNGKVQSH